MADNSILEPIDLYKSKFKNQIVEEADRMFNELANTANVNVEANRETVKQYDEKVTEINNSSKLLSKAKSKRSFVITLEIILIVVGALLTISGITETSTTNNTLLIIIGLLCIGLGILFICLFNKKLKAAINDQEKILNDLKKEAEELKRLAYKQMESLNNLYEWDMANKLVNKVTPLIEMDRSFDPSKLMMLHDRYNFPLQNDKDTSTLLVQSGSILGNPFVIMQDLNTWMGEETYTGTLVIHWTTTYRDSQGNTHTQHHTETLYGHVTKPKPKYITNTRLIYGNEAAPDLSFSREPQKESSYDDKELEKYCNKFSKKLDKMQEKDIDPSDGSVFSRLANTEFEALFHALNRDHETQFRLLFTPLAQVNEVKLLRNKEFYGDDFRFIKNKKVNVIKSKHSQVFDYSCNPERFVHYSFDKSKELFTNYVSDYFKCFYFDMAPLLSIPLYQQTKTREYIYNHDYKSNITEYEHEVMLNSIDRYKLTPEDCATEIIIKPTMVSKVGNLDKVSTISYGYTATEMIDYVSVHGGDGKWHDVPVHWFKYDPISCTNEMIIGQTDGSRNDYLSKIKNVNNLDKSNVKYNRGFISLLDDDDSNDLRELLNEIAKEIKGE